MNLNSKIMSDGLVKTALEENKGSLHPIIFDYDTSLGVTLMNPSVFNDNGIIRSCVRFVNYVLYHAENNQYPCWSGPLQYIHPENDVRLATQNYVVDFDDNLNISKVRYVDMKLNVPAKWEFHGLEDARLVRWDDKLFLTGVRRDTTDNGQGRMELTEIQLDDDTAVELSRVRLKSTGNDDSYCEKNWMPVLDNPFTYIKWSNPTEIVQSNPKTGEILNVTGGSRLCRNTNVRGGTHVIKYKDYYIAFGHSVNLWKPYAGEKDSQYYTHLIIWDRNFNLIMISDGFKILGSGIEFCCGLCYANDGDMILSFADVDNASFLFKFNPEFIISDLYGKEL